MYFDHIRCPSCNGQFEPEAIQVQQGVGTCPSCGAQLDIRSLFGVADQFSDPDAPTAGLDDLVSGFGDNADPWRTTGGFDPLQSGRPSDLHRADSSSSSQNQATHRRVKGTANAPSASTGSSSVLKALRDLKKD